MAWSCRFAGPAETFVIALVGVLFLYAIIRGFVAIRQRDRETHRVWMTRAFAIGLGITTVRIAAAVLDPIMTPMGYSAATTFVVSLWVGWGLTLLGTEWFLVRTARAPHALPAARFSETS
ncbi:MAG: DUF2306 domain-containing protein [Gemmatimonadaceae bacterium]